MISRSMSIRAAGIMKSSKNHELYKIGVEMDQKRKKVENEKQVILRELSDHL